jgi:DNA ligase 1
MRYSIFVDLFEELGKTSKSLEKTDTLGNFLRNFKVKNGKYEWIYLLRGSVFPDYDQREFGISGKLVVKALVKALGMSENDLMRKYRKIGDLGQLAEDCIGNRKQGTLFKSELEVGKVFENLRKLVEVVGRGSVEKKLGLISELLNSSSGKEAKYIVRTILGQLRVGVAEGIMRDSIAVAFFNNEKKEVVNIIEEAYDLSNDYAEVFKAAGDGLKALKKINIVPGRPLKVLLPVKVTEIKEAFRICGNDKGEVALEHKYDGFRVLIHKNEEGQVYLFTRRLENVTRQFPDVVSVVEKNIRGKSFIFDCEVVGHDPKSGKQKPFEAISQRIKRKYEIEKLIKDLPVEINVFDIIYYNGKSVMGESFSERRKLLERYVNDEKKKIRTSEFFITNDVKKAKKFYDEALKKGEEGVMFKKLDAPYRAGRRVGYWVKLKPEVNDLDLVIVGAEYGSGKRAGWLSSYIVACKNKDDFLEVGKVASGLKEKGEEGTTYNEMTKILKPLILETKGNEVKIKPKVVVSVTYQNLQKSPGYSSGIALRFPRITTYRPDRNISDITTLRELEKELG